ncbi:MAG: Holliday junction resolvase RuvX [Deltaproteobacteria bacterium]|nr:Holliday junction resolvase RuvX [Deltaproteobacteria bacterium]
MRAIGLDFGEKSIGVSVSDPLGMIAQGLKTIRRKSWHADLEELRAIIDEYEADRLIVGLPRNMDGSFGPSAEKVQLFMKKLKIFNLPIEPVDERLTTVMAERALLEGDVSRKRRKQVIDQVAAALILQGYLDRLSRERKGD